MKWSTLPPLSALRAFAAFHQAGSMSAAGNLLNVSHAAISQQIKALELHMGLALINRSTRLPLATPAGLQLAEALDLGFGNIARAVDELTGADAIRPLQVTLTPSFASSWLMPRLARFRAIHPEIDLMLNATPKRVPLAIGGTDLAIRYGEGIWPESEVEPLLDGPLAVVAAPDLIGNDLITSPASLTRYPWIQELGTSEATNWLAQHGVVDGRANGLLELPGNLMLDAARDGQGVVVTVRRFIEADIAAGRLRLLFADKAAKGYFIVTRAGILRPAAQHFITWLRHEARIDDENNQL